MRLSIGNELFQVFSRKVSGHHQHVGAGTNETDRLQVSLGVIIEAFFIKCWCRHNRAIDSDQKTVSIGISAGSMAGTNIAACPWADRKRTRLSSSPVSTSY